MSIVEMSRISQVATLTGAGIEPPVGMHTFTVTADMRDSELHFPSPDNNRLRLGIEADFGSGFKPMLLSVGSIWSPIWVSGPGAVAPSVTWSWNRAHPPIAVRGVVDNRNQANTGLLYNFS